MSADYMVSLLLSFAGMEGGKADKGKGMSMGKAGKMEKGSLMMSMSKAGKMGKGRKMMSMGKAGKGGKMMSMDKAGQAEPGKANKRRRRLWCLVQLQLQAQPPQ